MSRSRPEYKSFVERLSVPLEEDDPMVLLARSEGKRETDSLTVFPCPEPNDEGKYELHFFAHGLRYLPAGAIALIEQFEVGDTTLSSSLPGASPITARLGLILPLPITTRSRC